MKHESADMRHDFFRTHERLEEADDIWSWDELGTLPAKEPDELPEDSWIMPFDHGGLITYVITGEDAEIIGVTFP